MRIFRYIIYFIIFLFADHALAQEITPVNLLAKQYHINLVDGFASEKWSQEEANTILEFLETIPKPISESPKDHLYHNLYIYKKTNPQKQISHKFFSKINWKLEINVDLFKKQNHTSINQINRKILHHLIHIWEDNHQYSMKKHWLSISGWKNRKFLSTNIPFWIKDAENQDVRAYAYDLGLLGPTEDLITSIEQYIFPNKFSNNQESLKCRIPRKFQYIKNRFPHFKSYYQKNKINCIEPSKEFLSDIQFFDPYSQDQIDIGDMNLESVEGFELLFATPGVQDAAEIAGHLVLRIKLNNNSMAKQLGQENPKDLVVSFLANTQEGKSLESNSNPQTCKESRNQLFPDSGENFDALSSITQALKGLSGGFLTTFDRATLEQTVKNYTQFQDRDLIRYKLILTKAQKKSLIEHLIHTKRNFKTPYYFFDANCASILIKIIGQGIKHDKIANFSNLVLPPNSLISLFVREGLAEPVRPSFYSYKKQALVAQDLVEQKIATLKKNKTISNSFNTNIFSDKSQTKRLSAINFLKKKLLTNPKDSHELALLIQQSEKAFTDRQHVCHQILTKPMIHAREWMSSIYVENKNYKFKALDLNEIIEKKLIKHSHSSYNKGTKHTSLSSFKFGYQFHQNSRKYHLLSLEASLYEQDMADFSSLSIQKATFVRLGNIQLNYEPSSQYKLHSYQFVGLKMRKFKERVNYVPSYFSSKGDFGIGLSLLDVNYRLSQNQTDIDIGGGELLFNLFQSYNFKNHLIIGTGVQWHHRNYDLEQYSPNSIKTPFFLSGQWSDHQMQNLKLSFELNHSYYLNKIQHFQRSYLKLQSNYIFHKETSPSIKLNTSIEIHQNSELKQQNFEKKISVGIQIDHL